MINKKFLGNIKKYQNMRSQLDDSIYYDIIIHHTDENSIQSFLDSIETDWGCDNIKNLFNFPVRWKKIEIDVSDFVRNKFKINFAEADPFTAKMKKIIVTRKLDNGNETFDYFLHFEKESSKDSFDKVMIEAYLNYKEENDREQKVVVQFDVKLELLEESKTETETNSIF